MTEQTIRDEIARIIDSGMADRGRYVEEWPLDEAEAYRELGWSEGAAAARSIQVSKTVDALLPLLNRVRAEALREAADYFENEVSPEEFQEQSSGRSGVWLYIEDAWDYQGVYMDWLRNRADRIEQNSEGNET